MRANLLIDELPRTILIDDIEYPIHSDFRTGILMEQLVLDKSIPSKERIRACLYLYFDDIPDNTQQALEGILRFYKCGIEGSQKTSPTKNRKPAKRVYDYDEDDSYIFAAFLDQYGIDLNEIEYLHWWKFHALFKALKSDNEIVKIMGYRATDLSQIKDTGERQRIAKLKAMYALPEALSAEEKVARAGAIFGGGAF